MTRRYLQMNSHPTSDYPIRVADPEKWEAFRDKHDLKLYEDDDEFFNMIIKVMLGRIDVFQVAVEHSPDRLHIFVPTGDFAFDMFLTPNEIENWLNLRSIIGEDLPERKPSSFEYLIWEASKDGEGDYENVANLCQNLDDLMKYYNQEKARLDEIVQCSVRAISDRIHELTKKLKFEDDLKD